MSCSQLMLCRSSLWRKQSLLLDLTEPKTQSRKIQKIQRPLPAPCPSTARHVGPVWCVLNSIHRRPGPFPLHIAYCTTACRTRGKTGASERASFPKWFQKLPFSNMAASQDKPRPFWLDLAGPGSATLVDNLDRSRLSTCHNILLP